MALVKDVNSYVSRAEATTYFADRLDIDAWNSAADSAKDQALVTATRELDTLSWIGVAISDSQALAFPRSGSYFDPKLGYTATLSDTVPKRILDATCELAYHFLNNDGILDDTGTVTDLTVSSISLTIKTEASRIPPVVKSIIRPLLLTGGRHNWWRAN